MLCFWWKNSLFFFWGNFRFFFVYDDFILQLRYFPFYVIYMLIILIFFFVLGFCLTWDEWIISLCLPMVWVLMVKLWIEQQCWCLIALFSSSLIFYSNTKKTSHNYYYKIFRKEQNKIYTSFVLWDCMTWAISFFLLLHILVWYGRVSFKHLFYKNHKDCYYILWLFK